MGHHVHGADPQHGAVHVIAMEHMIHVVVLFGAVKEDVNLVLGFEVSAGLHQKTAGAAGGVTDDIIRLGDHHFHHHLDDMAGRAELAVDAGSR